MNRFIHEVIHPSIHSLQIKQKPLHLYMANNTDDSAEFRFYSAN